MRDNALPRLALTGLVGVRVSLTIYNAAAAEHGLVIDLWWFIPGMALATAYSVFTYRHFAGKTENERSLRR